MAQTYTRQSSFADGDTITAALFNNEYNQLVNAFAYSSSSASSTGHRHDGTAGQGGNIHTIGDLDFLNKIVVDSTNNRWGFYVEVSSSAVEQIRIQDGALLPVTDSDVDLGTSSLYFKDAYIDSITTTGNVAVGGNLTVTGTTTFNGGTLTLGDSASDNVVFGADVDSNIIPDDDNAYDLGSSSQEWKDLYIDGTANIDSLVADTADINGGTVDGAIIGGSSAAAITGTTITGTSFVIGSADISEAELETIDGVTAGTVAASKAIVVDSNKDFTGARNITLTGELDAGSLDVSGDVDVDGTLETDALSINGTAVTSTAAELNILDGVTSTAAELNILDGVTSTAAELNILDGVTATAAEINVLDGITSTVAELNILDGVTASATDINLIDGITNGTVIASKAIITDSNKDITGGRNITISGELDAATLDISGDADIDGTLEADAITIGGITLAETISDTVGAMVTSNTETNIAVTYDDSDNTLDFVIGTLNQDTTGNAATATALETARTIHGVSFDGTANIDLSEVIQDTVGAMVSGNTETNITVTYEDSDGTLDFAFSGSADTTGNAATATALETARTIHGVSFDGTANIDLTEVVQDTVGAMFSSNTESGITVDYQDADGTIDLTVGTLNQNTTGSAATLTTARTIGGVSFDGSANIVPTTFNAATFSGDLNVDSGVLFADVSTNRVGVNQTSPDVSLDLGSNTDAIHVPVGNTAARPGSPAAGYFRYNSETGKFEGYTDSWGAIAGGGSGTNMDTNIYTGDGSDTTFTLSTAPDDENNLMVFIDGVFQAQNTYSVSGTTLTFSTAPASGRVITVYHSTTTVGGSNNSIATMTGDGSDTTLTLSTAPVHENNVSVFFDGVYQSKSNYSISGTTLTFSTAPPSGVAVEAITATNTSITTATQLSDADGDTLIQTEESSDEDKIRFDTGGTERVIIDSTGVGIGTSSPANKFVVAEGTNQHGIEFAPGTLSYIQAYDRATSDYGNLKIDAEYIAFGTNNGAERLRITSDGKVGIGTTSPSNILHTSGTGVQRIQIDATDNNAAGAGLYMKVLNSGSLVGNATMRVDNVGNINFFNGTSSESEKMRITNIGGVAINNTSPHHAYSAYGSLEMGHAFALTAAGSSVNGNIMTNAYISSAGNWTYTHSSQASTLQQMGNGLTTWYRAAAGTADNTISWSESMRINADGNVLVGKTAANSATVGFEARADGRMFATAASSYSAMFNRTSSHGTLVIFSKDDTQVGSISTNANSLPSDRNFKRDIEDLNIGLDLVTKLKPVSYNYKIDEDDCPKMFGLIAQDLEQSLEEVGVDKNSVQLLQHKPNEDEKESDYALDYLKLTPILIKSIQEQQEQIEQLKAEVQTLKENK